MAAEKKSYEILREATQNVTSGNFTYPINTMLEVAAVMLENADKEDDYEVEDGLIFQLLDVFNCICFQFYCRYDSDFDKSFKEYLDDIEDSKKLYKKWYEAVH